MTIRKYIILAILISISVCNTIYSQVSEDSLTTTDIDSLLSLTISDNNYIKTASRYSQMREDAPTSITIINSNTINRFGYESLSDILRSVRGLYTSNDRQYEGIGVRGFNRPSDYNNRVLLLFDGHRLNIYDGAPIGHDLGFNINNFERVEIIRGPGSALYGTNAMLAVINLIPKKLGDLYKPEFYAGYGSFNSKRASINMGGELLDDLYIQLNSSYFDSDGEELYFKEFDSPENNNGIAENLDYETSFGINTSIRYKNLSFTHLQTYRSKGNPTGSFYSKYNADSETSDRYQFTEIAYSLPFSFDKDLSLKAYLDKYDHDGKYYMQLLGLDGSGSVKNYARAFGFELHFTWDIFANNRLVTGIEYRNELDKRIQLSIYHSRLIDLKLSTEILSFYFQDEYQISNHLSLYFGLRSDSYNPGRNTLNPRISINYSPNKRNIFRLIYGTAFREPNIYEQEYSIPYFVKKSENLEPETISTTELIWEYKPTESIDAIVSIYKYKMDNLIETKLDPIDDLISYRNLGEVEALGFEFELAAKLDNDIDAFFNYSLQKATNENNEVLSSSPESLMKFGISLPILAPLNLSFAINRESERKTVYGITTKEFYYSTLTLFTDNVIDKLRFSLTIRNLFNSNINFPGGYQLIQNSIPQFGRNFIFTTSYGIN